MSLAAAEAETTTTRRDGAGAAATTRGCCRLAVPRTARAGAEQAADAMAGGGCDWMWRVERFLELVFWRGGGFFVARARADKELQHW